MVVMSKAEITGGYRSFLSQYLGGIEVGEEENIFEKGVVNSLFAMQIILFVESEFGVAVESEDMEIVNFSTVNALARFVRAKQAIGAGV
jgi:acyl carrier protein